MHNQRHNAFTVFSESGDKHFLSDNDDNDSDDDDNLDDQGKMSRPNAYLHLTRQKK